MNTVDTQSGVRVSWLSAVAGLALGLLAILSDSLVGLPHIMLGALTDKGFLWALVALIVSLGAPTVRSAIVRGSLSLAIATVTYYGLVLVATERWRSGVLIDGSSASWHGLMSVGRAATFWLLASGMVGALLGYIGYGIRHLSPKSADLLAGAAAGALASGGAHSLIAWNWATEPYWWVNPIIAAVTIVILAVGTYAVVTHRRERSWWVVLLSFATTLAICISLWFVVTAIRTSHL